MVAEQIPEVIIVEDDVRPHADFAAVLDARGDVPGDWDVVTFHSLFEWAAPHPANDTIIADKYRICTYARTPMGTQAYMINQRAARRVLDVGYPICLPPDELLFRSRPAGLCRPPSLSAGGNAAGHVAAALRVAGISVRDFRAACVLAATGRRGPRRAYRALGCGSLFSRPG